LLFLCFLPGVFSDVSFKETPFAPVNILAVSSDVFSPGDKAGIKFGYNYSCPLSYSIDIYQDNNITNSVCTKIVHGMGWIVRNTYSGLECQKTEKNVPNTIEDVCGISSAAKDGSYTVHVILFDKRNNPAVFDSEVGAVKISTNKPDLIIKSIDFSEQTFVGQILPVKVKVENNGSRDSGAFEVALYLNSLSGKIFVEKKRILELKQGSSAELDFILDSSLLFPREYFLEAVIDSEFDVKEKNENNNLSQKNILLSASSDYPDLIIASVDYLSSVNKGEAVPVSVKVKNNGLKEVSDNFIVSVLDSSGKTIESRIVYGLGSEKETTVFFSLPSASFTGKTTLSISVDKLGLVNEASRQNNSQLFSFDVVSNEVVLSEECFNNIDDDKDGLIDEGCKTDYSVELSDFILSSFNEKIFPVLEPSGAVKYRFDASQKPDYFVVPFDVKARLGENKDFSAEFSKKSFCVNVFDEKKNNNLLVVFSGKLMEGSPVLSEESFLEFVDFSGGFDSYYWLVDGEQKTLPKSFVSLLYSWPLSGKENAGFYFNPGLLGFNSGEFTVRITSDCFGVGSDSVSSNDSGSLEIKFVSKEEENGIDDDDDGIIDNGFDLKLQEFYFDKEVLFEGQDSKAFLAVKNNGKFVSPQVKVYFFEGEAEEKNIIFSGNIASVPAGEQKTFSFDLPSSVFSGVENKVIAFIDFDNSFAESDESNNRLSSTVFRYSSSVSLKINQANFDRKIVSPGSSVKLTAKIKNNGFVDSSDFFVIVLDSFSNTVVDSVKVSSLQAGMKLQELKGTETRILPKILFVSSEVNFDDLSSITVEYSYSVPKDLIGNRNYDVCISTVAGIAGIDPENCTKIFFIVSDKPDLRINYIKPVSQLSVALDKPVLLELELENKGLLDAKDFGVSLYYFDSKNSKQVLNSISGFSLESGRTDELIVSADFSREINGSVFAEIDYLNEIAEDDESNNIVSVNLYSFLSEECFNGIDDDFDGRVDEDCPSTGFVSVENSAVKSEFVLEPMQEQLIIGSLQKITFYHLLSGPLAKEKITVFSPSSKKTDFFTSSNGSISFVPDETGEYTVNSSVKSVLFTAYFTVISEEQASHPFIYLIADFFFGSPDQTNPFVIPVILILAFIVASYGFSSAGRHYPELSDFFVVKPEYRTAFSAVVFIALFFIALAGNKVFGLTGFIAVIAVESGLIYFFESSLNKKTEFQRKEKAFEERNELKESNEKEKGRKNEKGKFVLRL
ncbi:MAG: CARDB domain-containing protein, partial [archaeon]